MTRTITASQTIGVLTQNKGKQTRMTELVDEVIVVIDGILDFTVPPEAPKPRYHSTLG